MSAPHDPTLPERAPLDGVLEAPIDEERIAATWQRVVEARAGRPRPRRVWMPVAALAAAAALVVGYVALDRDGARPAAGPLASRDGASLAIGAEVASTGVTRELSFDDGSQVTLAPEARLEVLANDGAHFVSLLDRASARFSVRPGGPRRWSIETALATVEVVGTVFTVDPQADRLVVTVEKGLVVVRGERVPGRVVSLGAGERLEVLADAPRAADAPAPAPAPSTDAVATAPAPAPSPEVPVAVPGAIVPPSSETPAAAAGTPPRRAEPARAPAPRDDAARVRDDARALAGDDAGPAGADAPALAPEAALREADALRQAGDARAAAAVLERAIAAGGDDAAVGLAAFTLGRIALDALDQPERAARAFARVIELGTPAGLLEDAYARRADALLRAGRTADARAAIDAYARAYPQARRLAALRARLPADP